MIHPNPVATKTRSGDSANVPWWNGDELDRVNGMGGRNRATKRCASQAAAEARETRGECPEQYEAGALEEPEQGKNDFRGGVVLETRTNGGAECGGRDHGECSREAWGTQQRPRLKDWSLGAKSSCVGKHFGKEARAHLGQGELQA